MVSNQLHIPVQCVPRISSEFQEEKALFQLYLSQRHPLIKPSGDSVVQHSFQLFSSQILARQNAATLPELARSNSVKPLWLLYEQASCNDILHHLRYLSNGLCRAPIDYCALPSAPTSRVFCCSPAHARDFPPSTSPEEDLLKVSPVTGACSFI